MDQNVASAFSSIHTTLITDMATDKPSGDFLPAILSNIRANIMACEMLTAELDAL